VRSSRPRARPSTRPSTKREIARLRDLVRDRSAREEAGVFVAEGPRVVAAAFEHGADVIELYLGSGAGAHESELAARAAKAGAPVVALPDGAAERIGDTRAPQPVFAVVRRRPAGLDAFAGATLAVVGTVLSDPGNVGTLMRSAVAAGASVLGLGSGSVDAYNPKLVRASAGACFAIRTVEGVPAVQMLETVGGYGLRRVGATGNGRRVPESVDFTVPTALVLGHEAHGFGAHGFAPGLPLDEHVTIPMAAGESLNVAMAGTALLFEAARQRRSA
jgi:TrmH family RNA methyltransferase